MAAEVVVVLGLRVNPDGSPQELMKMRVREGARVYHSLLDSDRPHPWVILTGYRATVAQVITEAEAMRRIIQDEGLLPSEYTILEEQAKTTEGNAYWSRIIIDSLGASKIHVVTSQYHIERTKIIFKKLYPPDVYDLHFYGSKHNNAEDSIPQRQKREEGLMELVDGVISDITKGISSGNEPITVFKSLLIAGKSFSHGFTTRSGGISTHSTLSSLNLMYSPKRRDPEANVKENRRRLAKDYGFDVDKFHVAKCVHGAGVWVIDDDNDAKPDSYDALVTNQAGVTIAAPGADCITQLYCDSTRKVCGAAHAGWKGILAGINKAIVQVMTSRFMCNPRDIYVAFGPSIGPCCFEVGEDVAEQFVKISKDVVIWKEGAPKPFINLHQTSRLLLEEVGIPSDNIDDGSRLIGGLTQSQRPTQCTNCDPEKRFFSYRRDGSQYGTQLGFINIKPTDSEESQQSTRECTIY